MTSLYPAMLRLSGRSCVVIGGGQVASRKIQRLLEAGASVIVVAPAWSERVTAWAAQRLVRAEPREYRSGDLAGAALAFAATDSRQVNAAVAAEAAERGIPVNVADDPAASTFQVPAAVERGPLTVAISTAGRSPAFARRLREELETLLSPERLALLELYAELRTELAERGAPADGEAWAAVDEQALDLVRTGRVDEARALLRRQVLAGAGREA